MTHREESVRPSGVTAFATRHLVITVVGTLDDVTVGDIVRIARDNITAETDVLTLDLANTDAVSDAAATQLLDLADDLGARHVPTHVRVPAGGNPHLETAAARGRVHIALGLR